VTCCAPFPRHVVHAVCVELLFVEKGEAITNATMFNQHTLRLGREWAPLMAAVLLGVFGAATAQTSEFACLHRLSVRLPARLRAGAGLIKSWRALRRNKVSQRASNHSILNSNMHVAALTRRLPSLPLHAHPFPPTYRLGKHQRIDIPAAIFPVMTRGSRGLSKPVVARECLAGAKKCGGGAGAIALAGRWTSMHACVRAAP